MKEKIKKILLLSLSLFVVFLFIVLPFGNVEARQGCCSWHGGVCGCQCCDGTSLSSTCLPYYPECGGGLYDFPSYDYDYPSYTPSIPDCPFNSHYDSISSSCKCYSGYVVSDGECISANRWCQNKYGLWATYDYLTDGCECMSGYIFGKGFLGETTCVSANQHCRDLFGYNARYNSLSKSCECSYGYVLGEDVLGQASCISENQACKDQYGRNAKSSYSGKCECRYGYDFGTNIIGKTECISNDTICTNKYGYNAKYNTLTNECECSSGYIASESGTSCISGDTYCKNKYGYYSQYDIFSDVCECKYGYQFNPSGTKCVSEDELCQDSLGYHAEYNTLTDGCACKNGYVLNLSKTSCIDGDTYCQDLYGYHSNYTSYSNVCECDYGYELKGGECVEEKTNSYVPLPTPSFTLPKPAIPTPMQPTLPEPTKTGIYLPQGNNAIPSQNKNRGNAGINFGLVGNELLRECGGSNCPVVKWGSINGTATILGENNGWYEVSVTDNNETSEGWLSETVVPKDTQGKYLATLTQQETSDTANWFHKFIGWISGLF